MQPGDIVYFRNAYTRIPWQVVDIAGYLALIDLPDGTARFTHWHKLEAMSQTELLELAGFGHESRTAEKSQENDG